VLGVQYYASPSIRESIRFSISLFNIQVVSKLSESSHPLIDYAHEEISELCIVRRAKARALTFPFPSPDHQASQLEKLCPSINTTRLLLSRLSTAAGPTSLRTKQCSAYRVRESGSLSSVERRKSCPSKNWSMRIYPRASLDPVELLPLLLAPTLPWFCFSDKVDSIAHQFA